MGDPDAEQQVVDAYSEVNDDGGYTMIVSFDDDNVLHLDGLDTLRYVAVLADAMVRAQYTQGVRIQLRKRLKMDDRPAAIAAGKWRDGLAQLATFGAFEIRPCVSLEGRTSVQVWRGDTVVVQFAERNVQEHIHHVLTVYASCGYDGAYYQLLTGELGKGGGVARDCIRTLRQYIEED